MSEDRKKWLAVLVPLAVIIAAFVIHFWLGVLAAVIGIVLVLLLNQASLYAIRANMAYRQGRREEALRLFERAAAYDRAPPAMRISYGYLLLRSGRTEEAEQQLNRAMSFELPRHAKMNAEINMALVQWKKGDLDDAVARLENVFEQFKTTALYGSLGYLYLEQGNLDKALAFNKEAREYNESDPVIQDNLGQTYYMLGEVDQASDLYQLLMAKEPSFPEPYYNYGRVLLAKGDRESAVNYFRKALELPLHHLNTVTKQEIEAALAEAEA